MVTPALVRAATRAEVAHVHVVRMVGDAKGFRFEPERLDIATGDTVIFEVASGQPHDVAFDTTAISPATARQLSLRLRDQIAPLAGPLLVKPGERYVVGFDGIEPGRYPFYCLPHQAVQMKGEVVVR
jgi:plastocyanin